MKIKRISFPIIILMLFSATYTSAEESTAAFPPDASLGIDMLGGIFPMPLLELSLNHSAISMRVGIGSALLWGKAYGEVSTHVLSSKSTEVYIDYGGFYAGTASGKYGELGIDYKKPNWRVNIKVGIAYFYDLQSVWGSSVASYRVLPRVGFIWR